MSTEQLHVVAIDGVLGSGKTTVAKLLAERVGLEYLDTGAMYRSVALCALREGVNVPAAAAAPSAARDAVASIARRALIEVNTNVHGQQVVLLDGNDVTTAIREPDVAKAASQVATIPEVRKELVERQRAWTRARGGGLLEGRDIASVVFPDAQTKVFLTASVEERARRRHAEQPDVSYDNVLADLKWRDDNDATRAADPLKVADGATVIDTTGKDIDTVVSEIAALVPGVAASSATVASAVASAADLNGSAPTSDDARAVSPGAARPEVTSNSAVKLPSLEDLGKPASRGQRFVFESLRPVFVGAISWFFRVRYEGLENVPASGAFIVSPTHRSNIDFSVLPRISKRRMRFMGKDSIWKVKAFGSLFFALGGVPVRRGSADRESLRICSAVLEGGEGLVVFPEGTRKSGPTIEALFDGPAFLASKHQVPILPIGIGGSENAMPRGSKFPKRVPITVKIGKPIQPTGSGRKQVRALTEQLQHELQVLFDEANG